MRSLLSALAAIVIPASVNAVVVNEDSPCANKCGNVLQQTSPDDLVCTQKEMDSVEGDTFQACVECEITSDYATSDGETDVQWGLYNVRYATSNCLFGYPEKDLGLQGTPCPGEEACGPFMDAIKFGNVSLDESYDYCALWPLNDDVHLERCEECLQGTQGAFLANWCKQQPDAGLALGLDGDIFSATPVEITEPTPRVSVDPSWFDQGPLDINAKAGIAAGGLVVVISIIGFIIIWRGKRRRRAFLATLASSRPIQKGKGGWPSSPLARGPGEMGETPLSQRPLRGNGWNDSPMTDVTEQPYGRYFSPYSSQYTSPVNGNEALHGAQWPHSASTSAAAGGAARPEQAIGLALSPERQYHDGSLMDSAASGRGRVYDDGSYEMHEVDSAGSSARGARGFQQEAPVLGHPGYGRNGESPPRRYDLTGQPPHAY